MVQHVQLLKSTQQKQLFRREQNRVQKTPQDKIPRRAVPQAGREPDEQDIQQLPGAPLPVSAKRDIEIIAEPRAERNMPAPPEFRDAARQIGVLEVLRKPESKNPAKADGHVAVAREIIVDLQGERNRAQPVIQDRQVGGRAEA